MAEMYFVKCNCGHSVHVELFEAGVEKDCPSCRTTLIVPNSKTLKELSGDKYPLLRPIDKIRQSLIDQEPPFSGLCQGCGKANAGFETPITLKALVVRQVANDGGIRPTITGGIKFYAAAAVEEWETTTFPLLLCEKCQSRFIKSRGRARIRFGIKTAILVGVFCAFLYLAYYNLEAVAAMSGILWFIGLIAWIAQFRQNKNLDPFILEWLKKVRWVPEALAAEQEFHLSVGNSKPIR